MTAQRSAEDRIAELNAKIEAIKQRDAKRRAKAKPEIRHAVAAARAIDKATAATGDQTLRKAFEDVRTTLTAALAIEGVAVKPAGSPPAKDAPKRGRARKPQAA